MDQIRLRLFGMDGVDFCHQFYNWNHGKSVYKNITIVSDDSYTHAGIFGIPRINLKNIPKEHVVGFQCEPSEIYDINSYKDYIDKYIGTYFSSINDGKSFLNEICYLAPYPLQLVAENYTKQKIISFVASDKMNLIGHRFRHVLIQKILQTNIDIDIFGRNLQYYYNDFRIKGTIDNKFEKTMVPYKFTISIENVIEPYFITEKFYDPILADCVPLYYGDINNINKYFNNESYIDINKSVDACIDIIKDVIKNHELYYKKYITSCKKVKSDIIEYRVNLAEFLYKHFNKGKL